MASIKNAYGSNNQAITCTITSLASSTVGAGRASTAVDNSSNVFSDALVQVKVKTSSSALGTGPAVWVYAYGTADGGTTYSDGISGTDGNFTATVEGQNPPNLTLLGRIACPAVSTTYVSRLFSVAQVLGTLPDHWGIFVLNITGQTLDASVGAAWYQGVFGSVA